MNALITAIMIGFAQHYLGWGDWLWIIWGTILVLRVIIYLSKSNG
jgi:hypothetical protein